MKTVSNDNPDLLYQQFHSICYKLKATWEGIGMFQRRLDPLEIARLGEDLLPFRTSLKDARQEIQEMTAPEELKEPLNIIDDATGLVLDTLETILAATAIDSQESIFRIMRAFRNMCRAQEKLYPIRLTSPHLDRLFLEPGAYDKAERPDPISSKRVLVGLNHFGTKDDDYARGSVSLYVPELYDDNIKWPLVVALHGGSGHGRDFIWTWLREARSRGFILISPTSLDRTWSILNPEIDGRTIISILDFIERHYNIDMDNILLTGISDGGTFALVCSLQERSPFTAFAPVAAVLPSFDINLAKGKRIYWIHGALDWMFPVYSARDSSKVLRKVGADIKLRVIDDLSHTYPREENSRILKWFNPDLALPE